MKLYSNKIGPVEYFDAMALVCFFFPYGWGVPKLWQACLVFTLAAIYWLHQLVKKEEEALRAARPNDPRIVKVVLAFGALMIVNAMLYAASLMSASLGGPGSARAGWPTRRSALQSRHQIRRRV